MNSPSVSAAQDTDDEEERDAQDVASRCGRAIILHSL